MVEVIDNSPAKTNTQAFGRRTSGSGIQEGSLVVVLTATIDVGEIPYTTRRDPLIRLGDYKYALTQWLADKSVSKIVFCENSGYDLTEIEKLSSEHSSGNKDVEILSFMGQDFPPYLGKGFGEMRILSYVLEHSALLKSAAYIIKVTGRLYVKNVRHLLNGVKAQKAYALGAGFQKIKVSIDVFCNLRNYLTYTDCRVFCCTPNFLGNCLLPFAGIINDSAGINFERALALAVHQGLAQGYTWAMLPVTPHVLGVSGTDNIRWNPSLRYWVIHEIFNRIKTAVIAR
jgi:hypothetical protein